jgi:hypothetical protein
MSETEQTQLDEDTQILEPDAEGEAPDTQATTTATKDYMGRALITPAINSKDYLGRSTLSSVDYLGRLLLL